MHGLVYIHVPKCGGSSFGAALRLRYILSQATITLNQGDPGLHGVARILNDYTRRGEQLRRLMERRVRIIAGHVRYDPSLHAAGAGYRYGFVTLLRDPVDRFVSHYNYLQRHHPNPNRPGTLRAFLDTPDAARLGSQYLFYFGGSDCGQASGTKGNVRQAIANLSRFDLIGDLNKPLDFLSGLSSLAGTPLPRLRRNRAPEPTVIPSDLRGRIEQVCASDISIYQAIHCLRNVA